MYINLIDNCVLYYINKYFLRCLKKVYSHIEFLPQLLADDNIILTF